MNEWLWEQAGQSVPLPRVSFDLGHTASDLLRVSEERTVLGPHLGFPEDAPVYGATTEQHGPDQWLSN